MKVITTVLLAHKATQDMQLLEQDTRTQESTSMRLLDGSNSTGPTEVQLRSFPETDTALATESPLSTIEVSLHAWSGSWVLTEEPDGSSSEVKATITAHHAHTAIEDIQPPEPLTKTPESTFMRLLDGKKKPWMLPMLVALEIKEEELCNTISVITWQAFNASKKLKEEDSNMLVSNTDANASLVTNSDMKRDPIANAAWTEDVVPKSISGVDHGETPSIAGHQVAQESSKSMLPMLVASETKEEEPSHITSVIISLAKIASRKLRHEASNTLVFNTEDNASPVTNSDMTRDPMANAAWTEEPVLKSTSGVDHGETPFIASLQDAPELK
jgi:hypothetical protein